MPANTPHRIDPAQHAVPPAIGPVRLRRRIEAIAGVGDDNSGFAGENPPPPFPTPHQNSFQDGGSDRNPSERPTAAERGIPEQGDPELENPETWLRAHAADLINHLQNWSMELDGREASLNARIALHERRERQFRIQRSELTQQLASGQARVDQLRQQFEARTRRLAFETHP